MTDYTLVFGVLSLLSIVSYSTIINNPGRNPKTQNSDFNRIDKMVEEIFPISTKLSRILLIVIIFPIIYHNLDYTITTVLVTSLLSIRSIFIHIITFIVLEAFLLLPFFKEYRNINQQLLNFKPRIYQSFIITITLNSLILSFLLIPIVNKVFDYSKPIEEITTIGRKEKKIHEKEPNHFYLYFNQTFYDVNNIEVTGGEYNAVNEGDQIKIQIADGLLGLKYKTGTIQVIKKEVDSSK